MQELDFKTFSISITKTFLKRKLCITAMEIMKHLQIPKNPQM